jgi:hypothetical protein
MIQVVGRIMTVVLLLRRNSLDAGVAVINMLSTEKEVRLI